MLVRGWVIALFLLIAPLAAVSSVGDPRIPSGTDPGGVAVALISGGVDYTLPHIASRLARDGEGELIGWDLADGDALPFAPGESDQPVNGTAMASAILAAAPGTRLVPVRIGRDDPGGLAKALAFVARTPARVVVVAAAGPSYDWELLRLAAREFSQLLIILAVDSVQAPIADLDNALLVGARRNAAGLMPGSDSTPDILATVQAAADVAGTNPAFDGAALKRAVLERHAQRMQDPVPPEK